ncbi:MAG TPA: phenylalanine 4-monooxygenase [Rhizomicrobium sp.]
MPSLDALRTQHPEIRADFTIDQHWERYGAAQHGVWKTLFERQAKILPGRACAEFLDGLAKLKLVSDRIPDLERMSDGLEKLTGWRVVTVPSLVPDEIFFDHLANRRFPAGQFIRDAKQFDYIEEPDIFHDVFGHVPMLAHPVFADYMQAYGKGGVRALTQFHALKNLARLYWYTVEFGLIEGPEGLRIYGSGIVSSRGESIYAVESPSPNRIGFDLERVMRTDYRIDDFQESYFVIRSFDELFAETYKDFAALYAKLQSGPAYKPGDILATDHLHTKGTHTYVGGSHAA